MNASSVQYRTTVSTTAVAVLKDTHAGFLKGREERPNSVQAGVVLAIHIVKMATFQSKCEVHCRSAIPPPLFHIMHARVIVEMSVPVASVASG